MDDMNNMDDMDESSDTVAQSPGSLHRRDFLTKAAAAGALAWVTPVILSRPAHAVEGGGGTPKCRPTIGLQCEVHNCDQGDKFFPGINGVVSNCRCGPMGVRPTTCIRITNISGCGFPDLRAYGNGTDCSPLQQHPDQQDVILSTGSWVCFDPTQPVFFGPPRSGMGAIPNLASCTLSFRMAVWAGRCPDLDSTDDAYNCQTFDVTIVWNSANNTANCTFTPAAAANTLCNTLPEEHPPCCPLNNPDCC